MSLYGEGGRKPWPYRDITNKRVDTHEPKIWPITWGWASQEMQNAPWPQSETESAKPNPETERSHG